MSYAIECKYLDEALETFYHPLILQKMKEDNISQLVDYDAPFCEQQYTRGSCYICSNSNHLISLIPPKLPKILNIYSVVAL